MNKTAERILLAVVLLGLFIPGAVRLADPFGPHHDHSDVTIDDSQPPAEMAYNAMAQTERRSHTLTMGTTIDETWQPDAFVFEIDNTNHRERARSTVFNTTIFTSNHRTWKLMDSGYWVRASASQGLHTQKTFNPTAVRDNGANVTEMENNETAIVLQVNDNETVSNVTADTRAFMCYKWNDLTLHIDRENQVLKRAVIEGHIAEDCADDYWTTRIVYRFSKWDETTVDRPRSIPHTPRETKIDIEEWREHHPSTQANESTTKLVQLRGMQ